MTGASEHRTLPTVGTNQSRGIGEVRPLGPGTRLAMRLRHGTRLAREVSRMGSEQRLWWLVPVVATMLLLALAVTTTTTALPVAVYTLF